MPNIEIQTEFDEPNLFTCPNMGMTKLFVWWNCKERPSIYTYMPIVGDTIPGNWYGNYVNPVQLCN